MVRSESHFILDALFFSAMESDLWEAFLIHASDKVKEAPVQYVDQNQPSVIQKERGVLL